MQLDLRDAARLLGVDEGTLQRWIRKGELAARAVHEQLRVDRVDLLEFAAARGLQVSPEILGGDEGAAASLPRLADAVRAGGVHPALPGGDVASALRAVVDRLPLPERVDRAFLLQMLLAREGLGSTALGSGIAIPHPRNPIVLRVPSAAVQVAYLAVPIPFDALDGKPVHTLFTVVSPSIRAHLHLLAVLAAALREPAVKDLVAARAGMEELAAALERVEGALAARRAGGASGR